MVDTTIHECGLVSLPKIKSRSGNITVVSNSIDIPFGVKRIYYLYDIPGGESRGGHAHRNLKQLLVAVSGSFDVKIEDGKGNHKVYNLNQPNRGLMIVPGIWRELYNFSSGAVCLVLASEYFDERDYIRNFEEFKTYKNV